MSKSRTPIFFFQILVVEAGNIHIVNIYTIFIIMVLSASTTKIWKKKKGVPLFFDIKYNYLIQNNNIIIIKLNYNARIGDADGILDVRTNSLRSAS